MGLRPHVSLLNSRKYTLQAKLEKPQAAPPGFKPRTCLPGRCANLCVTNKTPRVSSLPSNVCQLGILTKNVALPMIVCGLGPTELV